ncbi:general substrate transporter [Cryphonectria parasitica EP155]|uniref:General substrate transporter n=1 Tax=Cryphonectria parasitica (strain ATCC 38755 / EP155) TaxID=660469 RepID=A0A9P5CQU2_CRYP1|nr:general substrate transporter [Cryphonectria parasitica EP155]KAF3766430.1 general substrate transporter [Cryphonectria parasitica EP155]
MKELRGKPLMVGITSACSMGFLLFGYDQGVMGTIINSSSFVKRFHNPSSTQQGLITGLYDVGCLVGSILAFLLGEKLGRKKSIYVGAWIVIIGTILQTTAEVVVHLIVARIFTGIGVGIMTAVVPTWQAEVSQAHNRGAMITIEAVNIIIGFVMSNWVSFGASYATSNFQWIFPISLQVVFAIYLLLIGPFLVESPRWLAHHKDIHEATHVLARLLDTTEDDTRVQQSKGEIEEALRLEAGGSLREIFTNGGQQNFRRMLLGVGALYFQQMSGINTVGYYLPVILEDQVNMSNRLAQIVAGCGAIFYLIASLPPIWFIDRVGRRPAMMCGAAALTVVNILLCVGFNIPGTKGVILVVVMYFLYYAAFALSFLNVSWIYPPEVNSLKMRSMGASLASCSNWLFNGISVTITPIALNSIGWKFYIMWAVFNFSFIPMIYFLYPETKGLHLEQIDHIFEGLEEGRHSDDEEKAYGEMSDRTSQRSKEDAAAVRNIENAARR